MFLTENQLQREEEKERDGKHYEKKWLGIKRHPPPFPEGRGEEEEVMKREESEKKSLEESLRTLTREGKTCPYLELIRTKGRESRVIDPRRGRSEKETHCTEKARGEKWVKKRNGRRRILRE